MSEAGSRQHSMFRFRLHSRSTGACLCETLMLRAWFLLLDDALLIVFCGFEGQAITWPFWWWCMACLAPLSRRRIRWKHGLGTRQRWQETPCGKSLPYLHALPLLALPAAEQQQRKKLNGYPILFFRGTQPQPHARNMAMHVVYFAGCMVATGFLSLCKT